MKKNIFFVIAVLSITFALIQVNLCFSEKGSHGENTIKENVSLKILDVFSEGDSIKIKAKLEDKNNGQEYEKEYYGSSSTDSLSDFYILVNGEWKKLYFDSSMSYMSFALVTTLTGYYNKELTFVLDEYYDSNKLSHPVNGHFKLEYCGYEAEFDINNNILSNASVKNIFGDLSNLSGEELHKMGRMYLFGDGVEKDYNLSKQCFEMAAEKGYTDSLNNLALMILDGNISGTKEQARQYLETAGANGLAGAYYNLGRFISLEVLEGKVGEALMYLEKAVEMGDENAKKFLEATYNSEITNPDLNSMSAEELLEYPYVYYWQGVTTVAIKYWEAAASKGSVEALRKLGDLYSNYDTVTLEQLIDIEEAKHYYIEAATLGDEHSKNRLEQLGVRYY